MKRLDKHQSKEYGPVKVRPADLRELFSVLDGREGLELVADDIQFESPDELLAEFDGRSPGTASIKASNPYLKLELSTFSTRLYVSRSDTEASGLFARIDAILQRCERKPRFLFSYWRLILIFWLLQIIPYLSVLKPYKTTIGFAQIAVAIWFAWVLFIHLRRHAFIQTDTVATTSFWKRNSDSVIVAVISGLIGAAGGVLATKLSDHYFPSASASSAAPQESGEADRDK